MIETEDCETNSPPNYIIENELFVSILHLPLCYAKLGFKSSSNFGLKVVLVERNGSR